MIILRRADNALLPFRLNCLRDLTKTPTTPHPFLGTLDSIIEEFKQEWTELHGSWNPDEIVICYEFKLTDSKQLQRGSLPPDSSQISQKR